MRQAYKHCKWNLLPVGFNKHLFMKCRICFYEKKVLICFDKIKWLMLNGIFSLRYEPKIPRLWVQNNVYYYIFYYRDIENQFFVLQLMKNGKRSQVWCPTNHAVGLTQTKIQKKSVFFFHCINNTLLKFEINAVQKLYL